MTMRRTMTNAVSGLFAWLLLGGAPALAATFTVTTTADGGPGSLRGAIAQARSGDTIAIAVEGTIALTSGPLFIRQNVTIAGPGRGVLSIAAGNAFRVFVVGDTGPVTAAISGVTIRDGNADLGGGILNHGALSLTDVTLSGNTGSYWGGAIYNGGSLALLNSSISGNRSVYYGGGVFSASGSSLTMTRTVVSGNVSAVGGGMMNNDGTVQIGGSTFVSNSALQIGGGSGGAIYNGGAAGSVSITGSTVARNWTDGNGGAIYTGSGSLDIVGSTLAENWSSCTPGGCVGGGGLFSNSSRTSVRESTLYGNVTLIYSYVGGNIVSLYGTTTVKNSILAASGRNCLTYHSNEIASEGHNLSDDDSCGAFLTGPGDLNGVSAGLSPAGLRDNGGSTETIALLAASSAVDAVPLDACVSSTGDTVYDQRGVSRPRGSACDIGAFEVAFIPTTLDLAQPSPSSFIAGWMGPLVLSAALKRSDSAVPIAGAAVSFQVDGVSAGTSTTDLTGTASLTYDPSHLIVGNHVVQAVGVRQMVGNDSFDEAISAAYVLEVTPSAYVAQVQPPIRADGTSVFNVNRGVVPVKFTVSHNGSPSCDLPQATVFLTRVSGTAPGPVNQSDFVLGADDGSSFRTDSCQYVYNLGTASLGRGTYVVSIAIGSTIVGRGSFGLQ